MSKEFEKLSSEELETVTDGRGVSLSQKYAVVCGTCHTTLYEDELPRNAMVDIDIEYWQYCPTCKNYCGTYYKDI